MNTPATPLDALLARHAVAQPALDAQRDELLRRFSVAPTSEPARPASFSLRTLFEALWRELFVPCRGTWAAFACLWVVILVADRLNSSASPPERATEIARSDAAWLAVWLQQRRMLVELARDPFAPAAPPAVVLPVSTAAPLGCLDASVIKLRLA